MNTINLNGQWNVMSFCGEYALTVSVPGSLFKSLEETGYWKERDVFWRDNNRLCRSIAENDFRFSRRFIVEPSFIKENERIILDAEGLDTLTEIRINGLFVAKTKNMHRRYHFDIRDLLSVGENIIEIDFFNALEYIKKKQEERFIWSISDTTVQGFNRIRKCSSSFGWDWGPIIPDLGIWRDISITAINPVRLGYTEILQTHENERVCLDIKCEFEGRIGDDMRLQITLQSPEGKVKKGFFNINEPIKFDIEDPQLWWPRGYGCQALYSIVIELFNGEIHLDTQVHSVGLRTVELDQEKDSRGTRFGFKINGVAIFAMGGNIIPQDVYITRADESVTQNLLDQCAAANFNCIRVWGGGIYPDNNFYDYCDRLGLLIWHDLMFACALYEADDPEFRQEIIEEVTDNLKRMRNHPSIGLICGNNEMEWAFTDWPQMEWDGRNKSEYSLQYDYLLPELAERICPDIPYWKASPSSGGYFDNPNDPNRGDVHFWEVWHNGAPFTEFRKYCFRFLSEYGFQSFPSYKTVCTYTHEHDRNPYSRIMEDHQRNGNLSGNQQIMKYAAEYFLLGKDMDSHCYISQLSQAEAGRYAVEHLRQNREYCSGSTYWQVNDIWPVASWSSIDYFGRWKALHYAMKRAYSPILLSCREDECTAYIYVSTEGKDTFRGTVKWVLKDIYGNTYTQNSMDVNMLQNESRLVYSENFDKYLKGRQREDRYLSITLFDDCRNVVSRVCTCFVRYKYIPLIDPKLTMSVNETDYDWTISIAAEAFAKFVEIELIEGDAVFQDNYFDLDAGEMRVIALPKSNWNQNPQGNIKCRSLFDSY